MSANARNNLSAPRANGWFADQVPLLLVIAAYVLVRSCYWNCQPIWDGMADFADLFMAKERPFDLLNYGVDGHNCQGLMLVMGLPYEFFKRDYYLFNIWLTVFGVFSIAAFYYLLAFFFADHGGKPELVAGPDSQRRAPGMLALGSWEIALMTALLAFHPSILSSMIHFCLDMGVMTFFLLYWLFLLKERRMMAALIAGLLMFTKETALLLLPIPFLFCLLRQAPPRAGWLRRNLLVLALPYLAFESFLIYKTQIRNAPALWTFYNGRGPLGILLNYFGESRSLLNHVGMIFIMNFNWVLVLLWGGLLGGMLWPSATPAGRVGRWIRQTVALRHHAIGFGAGLFLVFIATLTVLTLVRPYYDVRYIMLLIPLMLLCIGHLSCVLGFSRRVRIAAGLALLALLAAEDVRTVDPLSKAFFGTFRFGAHPMLLMNQKPGEVASSGPDRLVYNLEFLKFPQLLTRIFADIRPTSQTFVLCHPRALWRTFPLLDTQCRPTFYTTNAFSPHYASLDDFLKLPRLPAEAYFVDLPHYDNRQCISALKERYSKETDRASDIDGYQIRVIHFSQLSQGVAITKAFPDSP